VYLGRYFQGDILPVTVQCTNAAGTPTVPDNPPAIDFRGSSGQILQAQMPVLDRYSVTGLFSYPLRVNASFPAGRYSATVFYKAGTHNGLDVHDFEVVSGGDSDGAIVTQYYWQRPEATYLVQQTEAENILLKRNPSV